MKKLFRYSSIALLSALLCSCSQGAIKYEDEAYIKELNWRENFLVCHLGDLHVSSSTNLEKQFNYYKKAVYSFNNEKPDVIILNGDNFMNSNKECVRKTLEFFNSLEIPFAFGYGNHDLQSMHSPDYIDNLLRNLQYALYADTPNDDVYGRSNVAINIKDNGVSKYQIYLIDSNSYLRSEYDCIHQDQIDWYERMVLATNGYDEAPSNITKDTFTKSMIFTHIPTKEFKEAYDNYLARYEGKEKPIINGDEYVDMREGVSCSPYDTNLMDYINKYKSTVMIGANHDHVNNTDFWYKSEGSDWDLRLIYGQKAGFSCYFDEDNIGASFYQLYDSPKKSKHGNDLYFNDIKMYVPYEGEAKIIWQNELA